MALTSLPRSYVDGFLVEWEANEYAAEVRMASQSSKSIKASVPSPQGGVARRANLVREKLQRTVLSTPEVMVKITSSCRGLRQMGRHIEYISRKGELELEDQDAFLLKGRDDLRALKSDWHSSGPEPLAEVSARRDTLNIVFSMPAFTDEVGMKRAVRAFAAETFEGHQYVFAYHTQATDPDPDPPAHPHVHLSVKIQARDGRRLNPRKADLKAWRDGFARQLRANGIDANATHRLARLKRKRGPRRTLLAVIAKGQRVSSSDGKPIDGYVSGLEKARLDYYQLASRVLSNSSMASDRDLALALDRYIGFLSQTVARNDVSHAPGNDGHMER